jgi:hypothetical protein
MKLKIFIGSSGTNFSKAEAIVNKLKNITEAEFIMWKNPGVFEFNKSALQSLLKGRLVYDFAILIATKDDTVISKGETTSAPRDNVIFEFGLYLGALGENRTLIVHEKGAKMLSDMSGITIPILEMDNNLDAVVNEIVKFIEEKKRYNEFHSLPSTTLAVGYLSSFLINTCTSLMETPEKFDLNNKEFKSSKINVIIPSELSENVGKKAFIKYQDLKLTEGAILTGKRPFPIQYAFDSATNELIIYDLPTTLTTIRMVCNRLFNNSSANISEEQKSTEFRELFNFKSTLENLIKEDDYCKNIVKVIWENEIK